MLFLMRERERIDEVSVLIATLQRRRGNFASDGIRKIVLQDLLHVLVTSKI